MGVAPGDRVAILAGNSHVMLAAHYAVPFAGAALVAAQHPHHAGGHGVHPRALGQLAADLRRRIHAGRGAGGGWRPRPAARGLRRRSGRRARSADRRRRRVLGAGRRRARASRHQLHQRHDGASEGRDVPPPRRLPAVARDGAAHGGRSRFGLPLDPADVPLQRLVLQLGGDRGRRCPPLPAAARAEPDLAAHAQVGRDPLLRSADGADDDDLGPAGRQAAASGAHRHRRRAADPGAARAPRRARHGHHPSVRSDRDLWTMRRLRMAQRLGRAEPSRSRRD